MSAGQGGAELGEATWAAEGVGFFLLPLGPQPPHLPLWALVCLFERSSSLGVETPATSACLGRTLGRHLVAFLLLQ